MKKIQSILLAAGQGTRMRSQLPKLLHPIANVPMLQYSLEAIRSLGDITPVLVIGQAADQIKAAAGQATKFAIQKEQLGTGHAVLQAEKVVDQASDLILVCNADLPLIRSESLQKLIDAQIKNGGAFTLLTVESDDARGFGRIVRDASHRVMAIVEEAEATDEQKQISELNVGAYCFDAAWLWPALKRLKPSKKKGEYYLTDLLELANEEQLSVSAEKLENPKEAIGVNTRVHLAQAEKEMRRRINQQLMLAGISFQDPDTSYIDRDVVIGQDTLILANTSIQGKCIIGEACQLGPNTIIRESQIGSGSKIEASVVEHARIGNHVDIGPFSHMRKGAHLDDGVHIGNYAEVKNSHLGAGVKLGHFSYIGDAKIGTNTNIGAGTITANYDGQNKNKTEIGKNVFIGSDTMLVAPLKIGDGARTGAGAVVTKDVAENTIVVGIPARAIRKVEK